MRFIYLLYELSLLSYLDTIPLSKRNESLLLKYQNDSLIQDVCNESQFLCKDFRNCVNFQQVCNQKPDCLDRSDETLEACYWLKSTNKTCLYNDFKCHSYWKCIPHHKVCDGLNDCRDKSDERFCDINETRCDKLCSLSHKCIKNEDICNGIIDCPEKDDEASCNTTCSVQQHKCGDSEQCIDESSLCDGIIDCINKNDEKDCSKHINSTNLDPIYVLACSNNDTSCQCSIGYKSINSSHCQDIDECAFVPHVCSQQCKNIPGSYLCICFENYRIMSNDSAKCVADKSKELIFYTTPDSIKYLNMVNDVTGSFLLSNNKGKEPRHFFALDLWVYDWAHEIVLLWSDIHAGNIMIANFTSLYEPPKSIEVVYSSPGSYITQIVFDCDTKNIYWYDEAETSVSVMNVVTKTRTILLDHKSLYSINSLTIYKMESKLFWVDVNNYYGKIVSSSLNGKHINTHVANRILPIAMTIDEVSELVYWMESGSELMSTSSKLGSMEIKLIVKLPVGDPFSAVIVNNCYIYSDLSKKGQIYSINVFHPNGNKYLSLTHWAISLKRARQIESPFYSDLCLSNKCNQLCLPDNVNNNYTCHCSPEYDIAPDLHQCDRRKHQPKASKEIVKTTAHVPQMHKHSWKYKTAIIILLCLTGLTTISICVYKRYRERPITHQVISSPHLYGELAETEFYEESWVESWNHDSTALLDDTSTTINTRAGDVSISINK